jgi:solute carrier family 25 phosphate transporter 3
MKSSYKIVTFVAAIASIIQGCSGFQPSTNHRHIVRHESKKCGRQQLCSHATVRPQQTEDQQQQSDDTRSNHASLELSNDLKRRQFLATLGLTTTVLLPMVALAADGTPTTTTRLVDSTNSLEDLQLGKGQWTRPNPASMSPAPRSLLPGYFCAYAACFLIQYDQGVSSWWNNMALQYSLMPLDQQRRRLNQSFAGLARSIQVALERFISQKKTIQQGCCQLVQLFMERYPSPSAMRHIGLLFAMLPSDLQPDLTPLSTRTVASVATWSASLKRFRLWTEDDPANNIIDTNNLPLLPLPYECARIANTTKFTIDPPVALYEKKGDVVDDEEEEGWDLESSSVALSNTMMIMTPFGPLSSIPLTRELPNYSLNMYALFGISGAAGCTLTHTLVIPLDVVKTRMQTDPSHMANGDNLWRSAQRIVQTEGPQGLLLGAQATIAGYCWYGLSVYPCYTFCKRFITHSLIPPAVAMVHSNDIALLAGALAAVVASLGLTPIEAARIRAVADPRTYRPLGLLGTLAVIASEDTRLGWTALYAGLPSLLTRQVIFGSVKFLAFERACDAIYASWPILREATWTSLTVSLVAGGLSGALSSVVSHPADAVLTYVAQNTNSGSLGVIEGCRIMVEREGFGSLFRGLGSRCVWAGSIIAGQFLLYDVFRTYFGVNSGDLSQVFQVILPGQS